MKESTEVILLLIEQNYAQMKQSEDQRATISSVVVLVAAAIQGGLTQVGFNKNALTITVTLIIFGSFGMLASEKLSERRSYYQYKIRNLYEKLEDLVPEAELPKIKKLTDDGHLDKYKRTFFYKISRSHIWNALHFIITLTGVIYTFIIIVKK